MNSLEPPRVKPARGVEPDQRIWTYVVLEGALALLGFGLAWAAGFSALGSPSRKEADAATDGWISGLPGNWWSAAAIGVGVGLASFGLMWVMDRLPWKPMQELRDLVEKSLAKMLRGATGVQLVALAAAAGIGEEILFRGFLQQGVLEALERMQVAPQQAYWIAVAAASIIFGLCHALSKAYLVAATLMGVLLGVLYFEADHITAPIVAHGVYDLIAIVYFVRSRPAT